MMRTLLATLIGSRIARRDGRSGLRGAAIGYAAPRVIARMGLPGLLLAGGYGAWRYARERRRQGRA